MNKPSKTIDDYLKARGWSSEKFLPHAQKLFLDDDLNAAATFQIGRTVVYLVSATKLIKFYVHYKGRSKDYLTLVDGKTGVEIETFHFSVKTRDIKAKILEFLAK